MFLKSFCLSLFSIQIYTSVLKQTNVYFPFVSLDTLLQLVNIVLFLLEIKLLSFLSFIVALWDRFVFSKHTKNTKMKVGQFAFKVFTFYLDTPFDYVCVFLTSKWISPIQYDYKRFLGIPNAWILIAEDWFWKLITRRFAFTSHKKFEQQRLTVLCVTLLLEFPLNLSWSNWT